jgi:hypothetical protein
LKNAAGQQGAIFQNPTIFQTLGTTNEARQRSQLDPSFAIFSKVTAPFFIILNSSKVRHLTVLPPNLAAAAAVNARQQAGLLPPVRARRCHPPLPSPPPLVVGTDSIFAIDFFLSLRVRASVQLVKKKIDQ